MKTIWVLECKDRTGAPWYLYNAFYTKADAEEELQDRRCSAWPRQSFRLVQYQRVSKKRVQSEEVDK